MNSTKVKIIKEENDSCVVEIITGKAGDFTLNYQVEGDPEDVTLDVKIKSF